MGSMAGIGAAFSGAAGQSNASLLKAFSSGVSSFFQTKTAKAIANAQAGIAAAQAETIRANKTLVDVENRQALQQIGRQQSALTAGYRETQGANIAEAGAGNVDVSSGSVAAVQEGNAQRYAADSAAIRRAYDLQQWSGESQLSMMEAQAKGYDAQSSAYRSVARLQGSAWGNALSSAFVSLGTSFLTGKFNPSAYGIGGGSPKKYYDPALRQMVANPVRH